MKYFQAEEALKNGAKICHHTFKSGEYIYMKDGKIYDENDDDLGSYWEDRRDMDRWNLLWLIYHEGDSE